MRYLWKTKDQTVVHKEFQRHASTRNLSPDPISMIEFLRETVRSSPALIRRPAHQNKRSHEGSRVTKALIVFNRPVSGITASVSNDGATRSRIKKFRVVRHGYQSRSGRVTLGGDLRQNLDHSSSRWLPSKWRRSVTAGPRNPHAILINAGGRRFSEDFADRNIQNHGQPSSGQSLFDAETVYNPDPNVTKVPPFELVFCSPRSLSRNRPRTSQVPPQTWNGSPDEKSRSRVTMEEDDQRKTNSAPLYMNNLDNLHRRGTQSCSGHFPSDEIRPGSRESLGTESAESDNLKTVVAGYSFTKPTTLLRKALQNEANALLPEHAGRTGMEQQVDVPRPLNVRSPQRHSGTYSFFPATWHQTSEKDDWLNQPRSTPSRPRRPTATRMVTLTPQVATEEGPSEMSKIGTWPIRFQTKSGSYEGLAEVVHEKRQRMVRYLGTPGIFGSRSDNESQHSLASDFSGRSNHVREKTER